MKKLAKILSAFTFVSALALSPVAYAAGGEYDFLVSVDDSTVKVGDTVTVTMTMSNVDGDSYDLYGMQDYIGFDSEYFTYVDNSIEVATTIVNGFEKDMLKGSPIKNLSTNVPHSVYVNCAETTPYQVKANKEIEVITFELKALKKGTTPISQYGIEMLTSKAETLPVNSNSVNVTIGDESTGGSTGGGSGSTGGSSGGGSGTTKPPVEKPPVVTPPIGDTFLFDDVKDESKYYFKPVYWAVENEITKGITPNLFMPDGVCTRAQAVTFLWRSAGKPTANGNNPFVDISKDDYYYDAVLWAVSNGITKGVSDTEFAPDMTCSRAHIVSFLGRAANAPTTGNANPFIDVKPTDYFYDYVAWAAENDITKGISDTMFSPNSSCKRSEIVTFIYRYNEN